ncbi:MULTISPECIES: isochorismatase family protein [unclassified Helicobacter]|uniref:isochorismatase family protein n=1 Tax=unclassified Helicobacter TaxID=2593540 RepID=UPI000804E793|nr:MULTISPECIES: isochorismatase family protein [unclassified Helicobacter]OBV28478.1 hypothetical protein BA723_09240 [Helicobacter sp. CLO-3]
MGSDNEKMSKKIHEIKPLNLGLFDPKSALLVVIDIQEKLLPAMSEGERVLKNANKLIAGASALEIPILITEQYPKGLGKTDSRVDFVACETLGGSSTAGVHADSTESSLTIDSSLTAESAQNPPRAKVLEKISFSIFGDEIIAREIATSGARTLIICGIESHVCVLQSVQHALGFGLDVWVANDALSSRDIANHQNALTLMAQLGAKVSSTESLLFGALHTAKDKPFKAISALVK